MFFVFKGLAKAFFGAGPRKFKMRRLLTAGMITYLCLRSELQFDQDDL
jgi:hypothetical protein